MPDQKVMIDLSYNYEDLRDPVQALCSKFPGEYWREKDAERSYPEEFVSELTKSGFLAALIPEKFGGSGLGIGAGAAILEEINASGGNSGACHAQMYTMGTLLRHGSNEQKQKYLPKIASGDLRLQAFGVTEPTTGSDTTQLSTTATKKGNDTYIVNGQKVWISRAQQSDLLLLLARTTPKEECKKRSDGLSVFLVELDKAVGHGLEIKPIKTMINHNTNELFFDNLEIPSNTLIGEEGRGFSYILDGMNAERILIAAECIGDARWFIEKATSYATERKVFGGQIGANQGVQFPIARSYAQTEAANLVVKKAAVLFEAGQPCGPEANMAKLLASEASWEAGDTCMQTFGGFGFAEEYDVERKFRETRLYRTAPISTNMILGYIGQHVLGMPRSY